MGKELINKMVAEHKLKVEKVAAIEIELGTVIMNQAPRVVVDKFLEWLAARMQANNDYSEISKLLNENK